MMIGALYGGWFGGHRAAVELFYLNVKPTNIYVNLSYIGSVGRRLEWILYRIAEEP
jgi:hypothetical protein